MKNAATNREGLTFDEWLLAAFLGEQDAIQSHRNDKKLQAAWRKGEDPTEYAAEVKSHEG